MCIRDSAYPHANTYSYSYSYTVSDTNAYSNSDTVAGSVSAYS